MTRLTFAQAREILRGHGMMIRKHDGQYSVDYSPQFGTFDEETAYYTDDLEHGLTV